MKMLLKTFIAIVTVIALISLGFAVGYLMVSNHFTGTPSAQATLYLTSSTGSTMPVIGVPFDITVHVSDNAQGIPITLYNHSQIVTTVSTNTNGDAIFTGLIVTSTFDFNATATHP